MQVTSMGCETPCINKAGEDNDSYSLDTEITRPIKLAMTERCTGTYPTPLRQRDPAAHRCDVPADFEVTPGAQPSRPAAQHVPTDTLGKAGHSPLELDACPSVTGHTPTPQRSTICPLLEPHQLLEPKITLR